MRLFERALRRAALPVAMSQGFNPRPQISLPAPLGVGITGRNEVLDFELCEWVAPEEVRRRLTNELPEGIGIHSIQVLHSKPDRQPKQLAYRIPLLEGHPVTQARIQALLAAEAIEVTRCGDGKSKTVNVAEFLRDVRLQGNELHILLKVTDRGTARPEEVLEALGCKAGEHYLKGAIERTHVSLSSSL
jgi:radical SAM-linked protein